MCCKIAVKKVDNTDDTIREVENLIQSNPDLPRLTRGEILDILENITQQDRTNFLRGSSQDSNRDPKALMVVKAYTPLGSDEVNVEEFYTKLPITSIIEDDKPEMKPKPNTELTVNTTISNAPFSRRKSTNPSPDKNILRKKPSRGDVQFKPTTIEPNTEVSTERISSTMRPPLSTRRNIKRRRRPVGSTSTVPTTQMPVTTYRPRRPQPPRKEIKYSNHKYSEEPSFRPTYSPEGIRIVRPPAISQSPSQINLELEDLLPQEMENQESFVLMSNNPVKADSLDKYNSVSEPSIELEIPEHLKRVVADLNLAAIKDSGSISFTSVVPEAEKNEADKIKHLLATIGVLPPTSSTTTIPNASAVADNLSPDMQELLKSFGLLPNSNDNSKKKEISDFNPEKPEIHPESYAGFKPLPEDTGSRHEMEDLLAQFGLLDKNSRNSKSLEKEKVTPDSGSKKDIQIEQISIDAVPDHLKPLLREMGLDPPRAGRKIREQPAVNISGKSIENNDKFNNYTLEKQHVFNPSEQKKYVSEDDMKKLGRLLEIMKKLEKINGTVTEKDMSQTEKDELKELITSLKRPLEDNIVPLHEQNAPNPVEYDYTLSRNEVKRQEQTTTEKVVTVTAESLPEETKTPSLKDLEESFGGSTEGESEELPEVTTPKQNGFYYLLDWNTFYEIDDQKGKRVNLRFQPKVGDPKRFLSVNVP